MNLGVSDHRRPCRYGSSCYQQNPMHREKFSHPDKENDNKGDNKTEEQPKVSPSKRKRDEVDSVPEAAAVAAAASQELSSPEKRTKIEEKGDTKEEEPSPQEEAPEEELLPPAPSDVKAHLKQKFLVDFPEDFFSFWDFCKERNPACPQEALLKATGLRLVGPYDLMGKDAECPAKKCRKQGDMLAHWRYYTDVPEFQTVLADPSSKVHLGYFRDDPKSMPEFVAASDPKTKGCKLTPLGENLFGALYNHLATLVRTAADPFRITALEKLKESVHVYATMKASCTLDAKTPRMRARDKRRQTALFHGAGMVVPFDKENDLGYREVPETTASLKKILTAVNESTGGPSPAMDSLHELITNVQFANDEGDPGMGLELGLNALCHGGKRLDGPVRQLLGMGYELVGREEFARVALAHVLRRKEGEFFVVE